MCSTSWLILVIVAVYSESSEGTTIVDRYGQHLFLCDDNSTISAMLVCNGLRDCADGTDETTSECRRVVCQPHFLKCDYGACVRDLAQCGTSKAAINAGCRISRLPANGYISFVADLSTRINVDELIPNYVQIQYSCVDSHYIIGGESTTNLCLNGRWNDGDVPDCQVRCHMRDVSSITFTTSCFRIEDNRREGVRCGFNDLIEPGVSVLITCKSGYQSATSIEQQAVCGAKGQWNRRINPCVQICGEEGAEGSTLIVGGRVTNNTKVPWHVGIYRESGDNGDDLDYTCGGTILNPRLVVSAIHCFWDAMSESRNPTSQYRVVAGKFYRRLSDPREKNTFQILHVKDIHYPKGYNHYDGLFANDVAVLVLESFIEFKPHVAPACINYRYGYEEKVVPHGKMGRVAGWGLTASSGQLSNELKSIELPVVEREACLVSLTRPNRRFVTDDKYCVGFLNMSVGVCQGDSGGGLLFPRIEGDKTVFYLRGLVSAGPNQKSSCDSNTYAFFTNTAHYNELIEHWDLATKPEYVDNVEAPNDCQVNNIPANGYAVDISNVKGDRQLTVGDHVKNGGVMRYRCANGTRLVGNERNTCQKGCWQEKMPSCRSDAVQPAEELPLEIPADSRACRITETPLNGWIELSTTPNVKLPLGTVVNPFIKVEYRCLENHGLVGVHQNFCFNGWRFAVPTCRPVCSTDMLDGVSIAAVSCLSDGQDTVCEKIARPGTVARIKCRQGYEMPGFPDTQHATCDENGRWTPMPQICIATCGEESPSVSPYIVGGIETNITAAPWHAIIYKQHNTGPVYQCGGTIINARLIITAINCLWDRVTDKVANESLFLIAVGKTRSDYDGVEDLKPQFCGVERIYYDSDYQDLRGRFLADIAFIVLKVMVQFRMHIVPICIPFGLPEDVKVLPVGEVGRLAGWGDTRRDGRRPSPMLKIIEVPAVSKAECIERMRNTTIVTSDTLCAGHLNGGVGACASDAGGGLVFPRMADGHTKFYLRGILSNRKSREGHCDVDEYSFYTNILYYERLITLYESRYRPR